MNFDFFGPPLAGGWYAARVGCFLTCNNTPEHCGIRQQAPVGRFGNAAVKAISLNPVAIISLMPGFPIAWFPPSVRRWSRAIFESADVTKCPLRSCLTASSFTMAESAAFSDFYSTLQQFVICCVTKVARLKEPRGRLGKRKRAAGARAATADKDKWAAN